MLVGHLYARSIYALSICEAPLVGVNHLKVLPLRKVAQEEIGFVKGKGRREN